MRARLAIIFILAAAVMFGCTDKQQGPSLSAPDFSLEDLNGKTVKLSDYRGKVVLLEFWATWCPPCRASIPDIERLYNTYKDKGLEILAVSLDDAGWDVVKSFVDEHHITYPVLKGTREVQSQYKIRNIPMMYIVNREGNVSRRYMGMGNDDALEKEIKDYL